MKLDDLPVGADVPTREQLETVALALARREVEFTELIEHIERQRNSLVELRALLLRTLWPRRENATF